MGGKFGLGKKKSQPAETPAAPSDAAQGPATVSASLLEMTTELSSFSSSSVSDAEFAVPAGFKKVESEMKRMR